MVNTKFIAATTALIVQSHTDNSTDSTTEIVDSCVSNCSTPYTSGKVLGNLSECVQSISSLNSLTGLNSSASFSLNIPRNESISVSNSTISSPHESISVSNSTNSFNPSATTVVPSIEGTLAYLSVSDFTWSGQTISYSYVSFSGSLTLNLQANKIAEGDEIVLFTFTGSLGYFTTVNIYPTDNCEVTGELEYQKSEILFRIDLVLCETLQSSHKYISFSLLV